MKTCTKCGMAKDLDEFHRTKRTKDGHHGHCKKCRIETEEVRRRKAGAPKKEIHYCSIDGCEAKVKGFGFCEKHLDRLRRNGHTDRRYPLIEVLSDGTAVCRGCGEKKSIGDFHPRESKRTGRIQYATICVSCEYERWNKPKNWLRLQEVQQFKLSQGCIDCGYDDHAEALEFDHRPDQPKLFAVSHGVGSGMPMDRVWAEIAKCDVVCANCHRVRTHGRRIVGLKGGGRQTIEEV